MNFSNGFKNIENLKFKILIFFVLAMTIVFSIAYLFSSIHTYIGTLDGSFEIKWTKYVLIILLSMLATKFISFKPDAISSLVVKSEPQSLSFKDTLSFEKISSNFLYGFVQGLFKKN